MWYFGLSKGTKNMKKFANSIQADIYKLKNDFFINDYEKEIQNLIINHNKQHEYRFIEIKTIFTKEIHGFNILLFVNDNKPKSVDWIGFLTEITIEEDKKKLRN